MAANPARIMSSKIMMGTPLMTMTMSGHILRSSSGAAAIVAQSSTDMTFTIRRQYTAARTRSDNPALNNSNNFLLQHQHQQKRYFARSKRGGPPRRNTNRNIPHDNNIYDFDNLSTNNKPKEHQKNILVIGSSGVLGKSLVSHLGGSKLQWNVIGADVTPTSSTGVEDDNYVYLPGDTSLSNLTGELYRGVSHILRQHQGSGSGSGSGSGGESQESKLDAIICASGGWAGDVDMNTMMENHVAEVNSASELEDVDLEEEFARESAEVCERMMRMNYYPIVAGCQVGRRFMKRGGLFCIIGASAALSPTHGMLGYGSAKSAAHHYLQSWGPASLQENGVTSVGVLPLMIDTPDNRAMVGGDDEGEGGDERYSKMVKPMHIANEIGEWIKQPHLRPQSGSLVKVIAKNRRDGNGGAAFHLVR